MGLTARLVYVGTSTESFARDHVITGITTLGRCGKIEFPEDAVVYTREPDKTDCGIRLSRNHARIFRKGRKFLLEDVGSLVGTYVNGKKIGKRQPRPLNERYRSKDDEAVRARNQGSVELKSGDVIAFGIEMFNDKYKFRFEYG